MAPADPGGHRDVGTPIIHQRFSARALSSLTDLRLRLGIAEIRTRDFLALISLSDLRSCSSVQLRLRTSAGAMLSTVAKRHRTRKGTTSWDVSAMPPTTEPARSLWHDGRVSNDLARGQLDRRGPSKADGATTDLLWSRTWTASALRSKVRRCRRTFCQREQSTSYHGTTIGILADLSRRYGGTQLTAKRVDIPTQERRWSIAFQVRRAIRRYSLPGNNRP